MRQKEGICKKKIQDEKRNRNSRSCLMGCAIRISIARDLSVCKRERGKDGEREREGGRKI